MHLNIFITVLSTVVVAFLFALFTTKNFNQENKKGKLICQMKSKEGLLK